MLAVSPAPHLPEGFTDTFTSRYIDTLTDPEARHASFAIYRALDTTIAQNRQRKERRLTLPTLAIGGQYSPGEQIADTMKLAADDVQTLVVPGCAHWVAEAVRSIVTCIRLCPSSPVPGGELAQIQGVGLAVLVPALGIAISARSSDVRAARQLGVLASLPPTCTAPGESSPAPGRVARSSVNKAELKRKLGR